MVFLLSFRAVYQVQIEGSHAITYIHSQLYIVTRCCVQHIVGYLCAVRIINTRGTHSLFSFKPKAMEDKRKSCWDWE